MARIFISHSSANNAEALALRDWLVARGWDDLFLDIDPVWQLAFLTRGSGFESFAVRPPPDYATVEVRFSHEGLDSLRLGLIEAVLTSFETASFPWPAPGFEQEADGSTPRRPYRGLKPVGVIPAEL